MANEPTDRPTFELRCTTPKGTTLRVGPMWSHADASAVGLSYLREGRATRVEVYQNVRGERRLVGLVGQPKPRPPARAGEPSEDE